MTSSVMKINRTCVAASVTDLFHTCFCLIPSVSQRQLINHGTDEKSEKLINEIKKDLCCLNSIHSFAIISFSLSEVTAVRCGNSTSTFFGCVRLSRSKLLSFAVVTPLQSINKSHLCVLTHSISPNCTKC